MKNYCVHKKDKKECDATCRCQLDRDTGLRLKKATNFGEMCEAVTKNYYERDG